MPEVAARYASTDRWLETTHVERGASLGAGAVILPGLRIGRYAMIGAAALVTRDVLPHQIVHIADLIGQQVQLIRETLNLRFGASIDVVVQLAAYAVFLVLTVLAHHDDRGLDGGQHR